MRAEQGEETLSLDEFESRVRHGRIPPSTPVRFPILTGERWVDARELELFRRLYEPARIHFREAFTLRGLPVITIGLVIASFGIFFLLAGTSRSLPIDVLIHAGAKVSANVFELGETWRLLAANLLHRDVLHLAFNLFFWFNVGGTIENAYRWQDYALIVIASGLGTTLTSAIMSVEPSVGASGIVLGLFGAASVFGAKYGDILPRRYRRYFAGAVLPYALFIMYVGLATPSTDNWGHLGGMIAGAIAAVPLQPKLLRTGKPSRATWSLGAAAILVVGTLLAGPIIVALPPRLTELVERESGIVVVHPRAWTYGENHLGYPAVGNALGTTIGVRARRESGHAIDLDAVEKRFLEVDLAGPERVGAITGVRIIGKRPREIAHGEAVELVIALESRAGPHVTRNVLIARGWYSYAIVLSAPEPFARQYNRLFDRMLEQTRLFEPSALVEKRHAAEAFPGMSSAHLDLARELQAFGVADGAARAYTRALEAMPDQPDALFGLVSLAIDHGGDLDAAEGIASRLAVQRPGNTEVALLRATLREKRGDVAGARGVLEEALERDPEAADVREMLERLAHH